MASQNVSVVMVVLMRAVGFSGSGYYMPWIMSCTSMIASMSVRSTVPFRIALQYSLSENGPILSAMGPVTNGVLAACLKWSCPALVNTSKSAWVSMIAVHIVLFMSVGSLGVRILSKLMCSLPLIHMPSHLKMDDCLSARINCWSAVSLSIVGFPQGVLPDPQGRHL